MKQNDRTKENIMINKEKSSFNSNVFDKNDKNDKIEINSLKKYCNEYYNKILINEKLLNWLKDKLFEEFKPKTINGLFDFINIKEISKKISSNENIVVQFGSTSFKLYYQKNDKLIDLYLFHDLSDKELLSQHLELLRLILEKLNLYNDCLGW